MLILTALLCCPPLVQEPSSELSAASLVQDSGQDSGEDPARNWGGWLRIDGESTWFQIQTKGETLRFVDFNGDRHWREAREVQLREDMLRFVYEARPGAITFAGDVDDLAMSGDMHLGEERLGTFELTRFGDVDDAHLGRYETEDGREVWVVPRTYGGLRTIEHEGEGLRFRDYIFDAWLPWKEGTYWMADPTHPALSPQRSLSFEKEHFVLHGEDGYTARRTQDASLRTVQFRSGDNTLHGWLMTPPGKGPFPAVAFAHGSGYVSADSLFDIYHAARMARHLGVAVLRWDKRGMGESGGDQKYATYHDLADDVLAAVRWLREQESIDPKRVGVGGISQSPSVPIPIAAAGSKDIAFVIAISGFVGAIAETNRFNWSNIMRREGFSEEDLAETMAFFRDLDPYTLDPSPEGQKAYDAFLDKYREKTWFERARSIALIEAPLDHPAFDRWRKIRDVDSAEYWARVTCPVFQAWGAEDHLVDAELSLSRMEELVEDTGQENFTSIVYPSPAGHGLGRSTSPTYFEDLARWFDQKVRSR